MMRRLVLPLVLQVLVFTRQVAAQYCYTDSYGNYSCDSFYLSIAARWAIGVGCREFGLPVDLIANCSQRGPYAW